MTTAVEPESRKHEILRLANLMGGYSTAQSGADYRFLEQLEILGLARSQIPGLGTPLVNYWLTPEGEKMLDILDSGKSYQIHELRVDRI